ncbi:MAG: TIGR01212 family radical SAM protein [Prevotella sp.]
MTERHYNDFGTWLKSRFPFKVQKISIDAGFTCPNRDGRISRGGCTFCDNRTFNPSYCINTKSISEQLEDGKDFFRKKYPEMKYLAYFQAYTNTYGDTGQLIDMYEEALAVEDVVGIVIGTRPDCMADDLLDYLEDLSRHCIVMVEYGVESASDTTLERINRGHDFACSKSTIARTHRRGILTGAHVILGLPGEDATECLRQASLISSLEIDILKIHQMQIIRGTRLAEEYAIHPFHTFSVDEYIQLVCGYLQRLRADLVIDRFVSQSPAGWVIAPNWKLKNHEFTDRLSNYMVRNNIYQGNLYMRE